MTLGYNRPLYLLAFDHRGSFERDLFDAPRPVPDGSFYDPVGTLRDVVQNHLLQLIGLFASEAPVTVAADGLRDKRVEVFKAIPSADPATTSAGSTTGTCRCPGSRPVRRPRPTAP